MGPGWIGDGASQCRRNNFFLLSARSHNVSSCDGNFSRNKRSQQWCYWLYGVHGKALYKMVGRGVLSCSRSSACSTQGSYCDCRIPNQAKSSVVKGLRKLNSTCLESRRCYTYDRLNRNKRGKNSVGVVYSNKCPMHHAILPSCEDFSNFNSSSFSESLSGNIDDTDHTYVLDLQDCNLAYKYCAIVSYDGTNYSGFQLQGGARTRKKTFTIQGQLEQALSKFLGIPRDQIALQGAGRTDAGVHARGQAIHFFSPRVLVDENDKEKQKESLPSFRGSLIEENDNFSASSIACCQPPKAILALNSLLPDDIRVKELSQVPLNFNVRYSLGKIYSYTYQIEPIEDPFVSRYRFQPRAPWKLNLRRMADAACLFEGTHDFSGFSSKPRDGKKRNPVRSVDSCRASHVDGGIRLEIRGKGFLYKQVRHIAGAILAVGEGRLSTHNIVDMLSPSTNKGDGNGWKAYTVASAKGLCLEHVFLPKYSNTDILIDYSIQKRKSLDLM